MRSIMHHILVDYYFCIMCYLFGLLLIPHTSSAPSHLALSPATLLQDEKSEK